MNEREPDNAAGKAKPENQNMNSERGLPCLHVQIVHLSWDKFNDLFRHNETFDATIAFLITMLLNLTYWKRPVSSVVSTWLLEPKVWGSIPEPVKSAQCRQQLSTAATFLHNGVAQALSRGNGPRHSSHA